MNNSRKIDKCIYAAVLTVLLLFSMTIITSAEDRVEYTNSEIADILSRINDEWVTVYDSSGQQCVVDIGITSGDGYTVTI